MKLFTASLLLGSGVQAAPLVSLKGAVDLATSSAYLGYDLLSYGNDKFTEALPTDYRASYKKFRQDLKEYIAKYVMPLTDSAKSQGTVLAAPAVKILSASYSQLDAITGNLINPVIAEFERRYPAHAGAIGPTLADRLVLALWVYLIVKVAKKLVYRTCCESKCC